MCGYERSSCLVEREALLVSRCKLFTSSTYLLQRHILPVGVPQTAYRPTCHHLRPPDVGTFPLIFVISSTLPLHNYLCHCFDSYLPYLLLRLCVLIQISEIGFVRNFCQTTSDRDIYRMNSLHSSLDPPIYSQVTA